MGLKVKESWSEGGYEGHSITNIYLALHREWYIEIDFSVAEGTSFPLSSLKLSLWSCLSLVPCDSD